MSRVFSRLMGLRECDGIVSDQDFTSEEAVALSFLSQVRLCPPSFYDGLVQPRFMSPPRLLGCTQTL